MSRAAIIISALVAAFVVGTLSAGYTISNWLQIYGQQSGPWRRLSNLGQNGNDPYTNAFEHVSNRLPVGNAEGQIYAATTDSENQVLNASCDYSVEGEAPSARLFTLRAENIDGQFIVANSPFQSALHSDQIVFRGNMFSITVSALAQPDNWLALKANGPFSMVLTYYDVAVINNDSGNSTRLPRIVKGNCNDA